MNKKTFNPSEWLNKANNTPTPQAESKAATTDIQADIETITRRIEDSGKDITAWCKGGQLVRVAQGKYSKSITL